jgi:hypothetical protein
MDRAFVRVAACAAAVAGGGLVAAAAAAELKPQTLAAFERYVRVTEARIDAEVEDERRFLFLDTLPDEARRQRMADLAGGRLVIERLRTREGPQTG